MAHPLSIIQNLKQKYPASCVSWALEMVLLMREVPNIKEGHFQDQKKGFGFESDYLAEMKNLGINTNILSFGEDWLAFRNKIVEEINKGFHPIVTIPSYLHIDFESRDMKIPSHAFIATSRNNDLIFITRTYQNPNKFYEFSDGEFFGIIGAWIKVDPSILKRNEFLNLLAHS